MLGTPSKEEWHTITSRNGKGLKVSDEDRAKIVDWVKAHLDAVASPIRRDTVWCKAPTPEDPKRKERRNKLLRTISVRVLQNDLFKPETGLPEIVLKNGVSQLSDTVLRRIMPPEVRKMSNFFGGDLLLQDLCESMNFKQDALNVWRRKKKKELKAKWEELPEGTTRNQRDAKTAAAEELALFMAEGFVGDVDLHPTASAAALSIQCSPPAEFEGSDLTKLKCASSKCAACPPFKRPAFELSIDDDSGTVQILCFATKLTCSKHGVLTEGDECLTCKKMKNPKAVKPGSVATQQDFAEALTIKHQKEVQAQHFGGNPFQTCFTTMFVLSWESIAQPSGGILATACPVMK